ncbi:hypothetical protein D9M71_285500 [compost metagenome]
MVLQAGGGFDLVHVEGMAGHAGHGRAHELAAAGEDQPVIRQPGRVAAAVAVVDDPRLFVDALGRAADEADADHVEQGVQRRVHVVHLGLVEARADAQFRLRGQQGDVDVPAVVLLQQAGGAQGAPQATESRADDEDVLFAVHGDSPETRRNTRTKTNHGAVPYCCWFCG